MPREELERRIRQTGQARSVEIPLRSKDGTLCDYLLSAEAVDIHGQRCVLSVMLDITERKQVENELLAAVQSVMQDTSWLGQRIVEKLAATSRGKRPGAKQPELAALPARAREVLDLVARGLPDEEIAAKLGISRNTLRNHIASIYAKLGVNRRGAVVVWARERGLGAAARAVAKPARRKPARSA